MENSSISPSDWNIDIAFKIAIINQQKIQYGNSKPYNNNVF